MNRIFFTLFLLSIFSTNAYPLDMRYKQEAELYIVNGVVEKSDPHAFVTIEITENEVLYKEIEDWENGTVVNPGGVFKIVSSGKVWVTKPSGLLDKVYDLMGNDSDSETIDVIRAFYAGGNSVNFLIISDSFLLEVKNSVLFGNAVSYMYYKRVK